MTEENPTPPRLFAAETLRWRLMNDEDLMKDVMDACLIDLSSNFDRFAKQLTEGQIEEASKTAHAIKGSAQTSDLKALALLAAEIETALLSGDTAVAQGRLGALSKLVEDSIRAVKEYFSKRP
ncbi:Hpt domain-containing protein [Pelagicoccus sp. SDUM812002]|uniref:Hpt domain-containing protein n=1 Tax=Pelagicoccus sp. SDUM812002 TaxID=3041266 RepID=UPI00280C7C8A|nr:Hpt domain-containing protein [Pelagicoccus sp. SDUM812002]MDQ8187956.1 Hpt domain-containing protein [Pelagicoccus sp. SDUM812002]